tara:strand:- start:54 stop:2396 length:2343 start_codon:yes stop_codon:yes gene_type:complete
MAEKKFIIEVRTAGFAKANRDMGKLDTSSKSYNTTADRMRGTTGGLQGSIGALRNKILVYTFAIGGAVTAMNKFVKAASGFQDVKTRLVGLTGSVEEAEIAFKAFNTIAATTPFALDDVVNAGAQLQAFGVDAKLTLLATTDLAAFMGTTAVEAASSLGRAFAGGAGAADILRERGILQLIKDSQGIDDLTKLTLPEFRVALIKSMTDPDGRISGSADRLSKTFTGAVSNMNDSITRFAAMIGDKMLGPLTTVANATEVMFRSLDAKRMAEIATAIGALAAAFAILRLEAMLTVAVLGSFTKILKILGVALTVLGLDKLMQLSGTFDHLKTSVDDNTDALVDQKAALEEYLKRIGATNNALNDEAEAIMKSELALSVRLATMLASTEHDKAMLTLKLTENRALSENEIAILKQIDILIAKTKATEDAEKVTKAAIEAEGRRQELLDNSIESLKSEEAGLRAKIAEMGVSNEVIIKSIILGRALTSEEEEIVKKIMAHKAAIEERTEAQKLADEGVLERAEAAKKLAQEIIDAEQTIMQDNFNFQIGLIEEQAARFAELEMDSVAVKTWAEGEKLKLAMNRYDQENKMMSHFKSAYTTFTNSLTDTAMHGAERYDRVMEAMKSGVIQFFSDLIAQALKNKAAQQMVATASDTATVARSAVVGPLIATNYAAAAAMVSTATSGGAAVAGYAALTTAVIGSKTLALPGFAEGGDFITAGPQMIMVGDNPGGREHVQVTPIGSPGPNAPSGGNITINISAPLVDETVVDTIIPAIQRAQRMNLA